MPTSKTKEIKKPDCITSTLWKKMKPIQKEVFVDKYEEFLCELENLSLIHNSVKAHNLAYLVATSIE